MLGRLTVQPAAVPQFPHPSQELLPSLPVVCSRWGSQTRCHTASKSPLCCASKRIVHTQKFAAPALGETRGTDRQLSLALHGWHAAEAASTAVPTVLCPQSLPWYFCLISVPRFNRKPLVLLIQQSMKMPSSSLSRQLWATCS